MEHSEFLQLVNLSIESIPEKIREYLENVDIVVEEAPSQNQLAGHIIDDGDQHLGLYEGLPLSERTDYSSVLPDKIILFQNPIESICTDNDEIIDEIRKTVIQEIAHHYDIDE